MGCPPGSSQRLHPACAPLRGTSVGRPCLTTWHSNTQTLSRSASLSNNPVRRNTLRMRLRKTGVMTAAAIVLAPMLFGTSPLPAPYHEYVVQGRISRLNGGAKQNFVICLVGRSLAMGLDSTVVLEGGAAHSTSTVVRAISDTSGGFYLDVQTHWKMDSLGIKVSAVDKAEYVSALVVAPVASQEITGETGGELSGCRGCETVTPTGTYVKGYRYQAIDHLWIIPL